MPKNHLLHIVVSLSACLSVWAEPAATRPNIILCMSDDQGWGDTGYHGHPVLKTPHLDRMADEGIRFERFYAGAPVCSPTRGSCLTGRHPSRYGIWHANVGHLNKRELSLAEVLRGEGYATGHFGKWHLGTLTPDYSGKGEGREPRKNFMPPDQSGFDEWFSTEYAVATWDPYDPANRHGRFDVRSLYWHNGQNITEGLSGCDSRIIMDKAIPFIRTAVEKNVPFFTVIWFHAPHSPVVGGPEYRAMYPDEPVHKQDYYGCVTALDEQVGRLRASLKDLGVEDNTMLWFCSDNGPARQGRKQHVGSPGPFRGFKTSLYEGGIRVPGLLVWPERVKNARTVNTPCVTSDYLPTILDVLGLPWKGPEPTDGISLLPFIDGTSTERKHPIAFQFTKKRALIDDRYKLHSGDKGKTWELYDLIEDPGETRDIAGEHPEVVKQMKKAFAEWQDSCARSNEGADYP